MARPAGIGSLLQLAAVILGFVLGLVAGPVLPSMVCTGLVFQAGYTCVRFPQIAACWQRDGFGMVKLMGYQFVVHALMGGFFYGVGRLVGGIFS